MTGEIEQVPERWRYLGRRETQSGRLGAMWKTSNGEELLFAAKRPPKVVGGFYDVTVHRNPEGISIGASPTFMEAPDTGDADVAKWEAEDRAAVTARFAKPRRRLTAHPLSVSANSRSPNCARPTCASRAFVVPR
jgi:hypothetical protein